MPSPTRCRLLPVATVIICTLSPVAQSAESLRVSMQNPERPIPNPGMLVKDLKHFYGEPSTTHESLDGSSTEVWDYGTFRTFVSHGMVQRSKRW